MTLPLPSLESHHPPGDPPPFVGSPPEWWPAPGPEARARSDGPQDRHEERSPKGPDPDLSRHETKTCEPAWLTLKCECGSHGIQAYGCQSEDCPECSTATAARRTSRTLSRFDQRPPDTDLGITVFTVPPDLRERCTPEAWRKVRTTMIQALKDDFHFLYGCESSHPTGDDLTTFHPHLNVMWVRCNPFSARLPKWELRALRERWKTTLREVIGGNPPTVDIFHHFWRPRTKAARTKFAARLDYIYRPFPGWSHWTGYRNRWYHLPGFKLPKAIEEDWCCPCCGRPFQVCWSSEQPTGVVILSSTADLCPQDAPFAFPCRPP